uniref:Uncharacterized protein LOC111125694 isoform X1 n=1 Tax=Crassostrea virginica TaxID=6565 RepID=A0A8B8DCQ7_CRAVI|nr:uncharacterized protein LOC111125694 isoform X1 [Crassostrea virginica]
MDAVSARFFLFRSVMAVMLSQIGVFLLVPALIAFATKFPKVFDNQETDCSIKVAFVCVLISASIETVLWCWTMLVVFVAVETDGFCHLRCYHIEVLLHFIAAGCSGVGTSIYSYKYDINVWYWIFAVGGGACAGMNSFIGCCCQNIKRKVKHGLDDLGLGEIDLKAFKKK